MAPSRRQFPCVGDGAGVGLVVRAKPSKFKSRVVPTERWRVTVKSARGGSQMSTTTETEAMHPSVSSAVKVS